MTLKNIDLFDISRFRAEHMGMAIIFIMLFHVPLPRADEFYGLYRMGNIGVDIFLFLSGLGLWFSWCKTDGKDFWHSYILFYFKRLLRIYPAWFMGNLLLLMALGRSAHGVCGGGVNQCL